MAMASNLLAMAFNLMATGVNSVNSTFHVCWRDSLFPSRKSLRQADKERRHVKHMLHLAASAPAQKLEVLFVPQRSLCMVFALYSSCSSPEPPPKPDLSHRERI